MCHDEQATPASKTEEPATEGVGTPSKSEKKVEEESEIFPTLGLASLTPSTNNNNTALASLFNTNTSTNPAQPSASAPATAQSESSAGGGSGLNGAGWLGLGGGPGGFEGGGSGFGGDSAGGNEFTLLSEFLESLDGPGFGAGATPGMSNNNLPTGLTPSQSRRNTISNPSTSNSLIEGFSITPINPPAPAPSFYPANDSSSGYNNGYSSSGMEKENGKRSRRNSASTAQASGSYLPSLQGGSSKTERFFLTAADQKDGTRDERLARVIQAKYEAGLLRPYNHVNGYARLNRWMERNVSSASKRRILKPLSVFRPAFRAVAQSLTNIDLIFIEEAFERLLLDYDRVFSTQGIPACLWRRTGEIYKGNKEFAELVGVPIESLREGRLCIYELMAEESAVNYWEKYGAVSFDPGQKAVLTSCVLRTKNKAIVATGTGAGAIATATATGSGGGSASRAIQAQLPRSATASGQITPAEVKEEEKAVAAGTGATSTSGVLKDPNNPKAAFIHCCFSFTIRRDQWNIPHMIVGNFLPTNPT